MSSGDFVPALGQFLGSPAGLPGPVITKLTQTWQAGQKAFAGRDLSGTDCVYLWADGIQVNIRVEEHKLCLLVMLGVRADGRKELIALAEARRRRWPGSGAPGDKHHAVAAVKAFGAACGAKFPKVAKGPGARIAGLDLRASPAPGRRASATSALHDLLR